MVNLARFKSILPVSISVVLAACGGGGGGGGSYINTGGNYLRSSVPYEAPIRINSYTPLIGSTYRTPLTEIYSKDLNNDGKQEVVVQSVGFTTDVSSWQKSALQIYGWNSGSFKNETTTWFTGDENITPGGTTVRFGDFTGKNRVDMFVPTFTDNSLYFPSTVYFNTGTNKFTKVSIDFGDVQPHDSLVTDFNNDGYADILVMDINKQRPAMAFGSASGAFTIYRSDILGGGSGVSVADYLNNGTKTIVMTDAPNTGNQDTKLYQWDVSTGKLVLTEIAILPADRFYLSKWDSVRAASPYAPHAVRNIAFDFNNDGRKDVVVFSVMEGRGLSIGYAEIQFLRNDGSGKFTDVTDSTLVGFNSSKSLTYNPVLIDINNDGLMDIMISQGNLGTTDKNTSVLLQTKEGKFVESYASEFQDFTNQIRSSTANGGTVQPISVVKGPNNDLYLFGLVEYSNNNGVAQMATYLSRIGSSGTVNPQATIQSIIQAWPWLNPVQANEILAKTASQFIDGIPVIDPDKIWSPYGPLVLNTATGFKPITGHINGVRMDGAGDALVAFDGLNRAWQVDLSSRVLNRQFNSLAQNSEHVDQFDLSSHSEYLINANMNNVGPLRMGYEDRNQHNTLNYNDPSVGPVIGALPRNYSIGMPKIWSSGPWTMGAQYTTLSHNPWLSISGSWGSITGSSTLDYVLSYRNREWSARIGMMQTVTQFSPGLVTKINPVVGTWAEIGYRYNNIGVYAGVKPTVILGSIEALLPTGVDQQGRTIYSHRRLLLDNETTTYIRGLVQVDLSRNYALKFGGTIMSNGMYRVMNELRYQF